MSTVVAQILTKDVKIDPKKTLYEVSFVVATREQIRSLRELNDSNHDFILGECSAEIELVLENKKCEIQLVVSGALKPLLELEEGEDILEYNEALSECKKQLFLVPTYNAASAGTAAIKFKINRTIRHTVYIKDVPIAQRETVRSGSMSIVDNGKDLTKQKTEELVTEQLIVTTKSWSLQKGETQTGSASNCSLSVLKRKTLLTDENTLSSPVSNIAVDSSLTLQKPENVASSLSSLPGEKTDASCSEEGQETYPSYGSTREQLDYAEGDAQTDEGLKAKPVPPIPSGQQSDDYSHQTTPVYESTCEGAAAMHAEESAYDKILSNKSLQVLAHALPHGDAHSLSVYLGVPNSVFENFKKNHQHDIVSCHYQSLIHWRQERTSRRKSPAVGNQVLYEDLMKALGKTGRNDIKGVIERSFKENKQLEKHDFDHH